MKTLKTLTLLLASAGIAYSQTTILPAITTNGKGTIEVTQTDKDGYQLTTVSAPSNLNAPMSIPLDSDSGQILYLMPGQNTPKASHQGQNRKVYQSIRYQVPDSTIDKTSSFESKKIIVEFRGIPYFKQTVPPGGLKSTAAMYNSIFETFEDDLSSILSNGQSKKSGSQQQPSIRARYKNVFLGVATEVPAGCIAEIEKLDYVKAVHYDREIKAFETNMNYGPGKIQADSVWQKYGNQGDSITIGIIDTGIDYLHPALGGGFGPGFKVIGGYDFVNLDDDPMDDHSHGTHVAGIAAGNGDSLKGVAPQALLYGYKVLDSLGGGLESDIISAVERCTDPNGDGNASDRLDVVNMSLGSQPIENDPMVVAVNNATDMGIVFCIAAGNSGNYNTIGSPGIAESAITVGASDQDDNIAYFSSRGPSFDGFSIKPDVAAPGYDVKSCVPGGSYEMYNGTSMAAPHVAGACALICRQHPDWRPEEIKAALMNTATKISESVFSQGAGRIETLKAIETNTLVTPVLISEKMPSGETNTVVTRQLSVKNLNPQAQLYTIQSNDITPGITITFSDNNFTLNSGDSLDIAIVFDIDRISLPTTTDREPGFDYTYYSGNLVVTSSIDSTHIPWGIFDKKEIKVFIEGKVSGLGLLKKGLGKYYAFFPQIIADTISLPYKENAPHYLMGCFTDSARIKYQIIPVDLTIPDLDSVYKLSNLDTFYTITYLGSDEKGNTLKYEGQRNNFLHLELADDLALELEHNYQNPYPGSGLVYSAQSCVYQYNFDGEFSFLGISQLIQMDTEYDEQKAGIYEIACSYLPKNIKINAGQIQGTSMVGYNINYSEFQGLSIDTILSNQPAGYLEQDIVVEKAKKVYCVPQSFKSANYTGGSMGWWNIPVNFTYNHKTYLTPFTNQTVYYGTYYVDYDWRNSLNLGGLIAEDDSVYNNPFYWKSPKENFELSPAGTITQYKGGTPLITQNNFYDDEFNNYFNISIIGQIGEEIANMSDSLEVYYSDGSMITSRVTSIENTPCYGKGIVETKAYKSFTLNNKTGQVKLNSNFTGNVANSPRIRSFVLKNNLDVITNIFTPEDDVHLIFNLYSFESPVIKDSISLNLKLNNGSTWIPIEYQIISDSINPYWLKLNSKIDNESLVDSAFYDLKIRAVDSSGNTIELEITRAFLVHNFSEPTAIDDYYNAKPNQTIKLSPLSNDTFGGLTSSDYTVFPVSYPENGVLAYNFEKFTYRPNRGFEGTDTIGYYLINASHISNIAKILVTVKGKVTDITFPEVSDTNPQAFPNPFSDFITICFNTSLSQPCQVMVFDLQGKTVSVLHNGQLTAGNQTFTWDGTTASGQRANPGIYILKVVAGSINESFKVLLTE